MLGVLVDAMPGDWTRIDLPWSAAYGPVNPNRDPFGESFEHALAGGYRMLDRAIRAMNGPVVVAGYSGGAALVGNLLARNHYPNVTAVILVADPLAPGGRVHGIAGSRTVPGHNARWVSNPADVICSCPEGSPLIRMADLSAAMSLGDPAGWSADILDRLATNRWQAVKRQWWNPAGVLGAYMEAADDATGYLGPPCARWSEHTVPYTTKGPDGKSMLDHAADWVTTVVRHDR